MRAIGSQDCDCGGGDSRVQKGMPVGGDDGRGIVSGCCASPVLWPRRAGSARRVRGSPWALVGQRADTESIGEEWRGFEGGRRRDAQIT